MFILNNKHNPLLFEQQFNENIQKKMNKDKEECIKDMSYLISFKSKHQLEKFVDDLFIENLYFHRMTILLTQYQVVNQQTLLTNIQRLNRIYNLFKLIYNEIKFYEMIIFTPGYSLLQRLLNMRPSKLDEIINYFQHQIINLKYSSLNTPSNNLYSNNTYDNTCLNNSFLNDTSLTNTPPTNTFSNNTSLNNTFSNTTFSNTLTVTDTSLINPSIDGFYLNLPIYFVSSVINMYLLRPEHITRFIYALHLITTNRSQHKRARVIIKTEPVSLYKQRVQDQTTSQITSQTTSQTISKTSSNLSQYKQRLYQQMQYTVKIQLLKGVSLQNLEKLIMKIHLDLSQQH